MFGETLFMGTCVHPVAAQEGWVREEGIHWAPDIQERRHGGTDLVTWDSASSLRCTALWLPDLLLLGP